MSIADPGWKLIGVGFVAAAVLGFVWPPWVLLGLSFSAFSAYFFRDPVRTTPPDPDAAYSPGDGRVLKVSREGPGEITTLRIFLSVFNVHVQRFPFSGKVLKVHHQEGTFKIASLAGAVKNDRKVLTLERPEGVAVLEQITGAVARRIRCYVNIGDEVVQGQRWGIIYFGSQVAMHLPKGWEFCVKPGDRVVGGETVVARRVASKVEGSPEAAAAKGNTA